jgi:hypothetical protein
MQLDSWGGGGAGILTSRPQHADWALVLYGVNIGTATPYADGMPPTAVAAKQQRRHEQEQNLFRWKVRPEPWVRYDIGC